MALKIASLREIELGFTERPSMSLCDITYTGYAADGYVLATAQLG